MTCLKWFGSLFLLLLGTCISALGAYVGINIGTEMSTQPTEEEILSLLKLHEFKHVRLYDADPRLLKALAGSGIEVTVGVTNQEVLGIGESHAKAASWINRNVAAYIPSTNITAIAVGSEVITTMPHVAPVLVDAMNHLHLALIDANLNRQVKVSSPVSMDLIPRPFPPSAATFNSSWNSTMKWFLQLLKNTDSYFMLNAFPYDGYTDGDGIFPLEYALFRPLSAVKQIVDPNSLFHYNSMFEAMVDAAYYSIEDLGFSGIPIVISETGWPSLGGGKDPDANVKNAETYNNNLVRRVLNGSGPPAQPYIPMNTYIYELFNEDRRPGPELEKNWGVLYMNGSAVYPLSPTASSQATGIGSADFCVAKSDADSDKLEDGLNWACGKGQANCSAIQSGRACFLPDNLVNHASYAYNDYYQKMRSVGATCDFDGTAITVNTDPSYGTCVFAGSSNSSTNGTFSPPTATPGLASRSWPSLRPVSMLQLLFPATILGSVLC